MSNEKPVRITVGDVKEVTEATTVQPESSKEVFAQAAQTPAMSTPSTRPAPNTGIILIGFVVGILFLLLAAKAAFSGNLVAPVINNNNAPASNSAGNAPSGANNAPAATNNAPAEANNATASASNNATAEANTPAADANAAANAPTAANNAPK